MKKNEEKIIVANWKMNGSLEMANAWAAEMREKLTLSYEVQATIVVCPPAPLIHILKNALSDLPIFLGGQDCHVQVNGAYTGDISADLLKNIGAEYVIVGHSERREGYSETSEMVCAKAARALQTGLTPIICIGETAKQRDAGQTLAVLAKQVRESVPRHPDTALGAVEGSSGLKDPSVASLHKDDKNHKIILAYEPVWAIGSGNIPTLNEIKTAHQAIILEAAKHTGLAEANVYVLYGGSVKPENAAEIMQIAGVAGVLVGGASLKAGEFFKIAVSGQ